MIHAQICFESSVWRAKKHDKKCCDSGQQPEQDDETTEDIEVDRPFFGFRQGPYFVSTSRALIAFIAASVRLFTCKAFRILLT